MMELLRRIWYLCNRGRLEREMADEMAYHRELMPVDRRGDFGSDMRMRENAREIWGWAWLDRLRQDLGYGSRILRRSPGFTLTAMLVLALGIGVPLTTLRAGLADLRRGAPPDPDSLVRLTRRAPGMLNTVLPYPELVFYAGHARSFRSVIGLSERNPAVLGDREQASVTFATANYFSEFGLSSANGRLLVSDDELPDAEAVALLGESFWRRRFGGDTAVIGTNIRLNGKPVRVVGIVPRSSRDTADVWMPLVRQPYIVEGSALLVDWNSTLELYARLRPGVSAKASEEETRALAARLREMRPDNVQPGEYLGARPILQLNSDSSEFQAILTTIVLVFLLLMAACANLGTLVLARGVTREREIRTRMALGAGRPRVVRQLFTESILLAVLSGACALVISSVALKWLELQRDFNAPSSLFPGWPALAATIAIALLAATVFGLPPALRLTHAAPRAGRARTVFLGAQVAASCLLLVVSTLLMSSVGRLSSADPGFDYRSLLWISPGLNSHGYNGQTARAFLNELRVRATGMPGTNAASVVWLAPWGNVHNGNAWQGRQFSGNHVDPQFLDTMRMRLVRGRNFLAGERDVALLSETAARTLFPGRDALGQTLSWQPHGPTVIGIVHDASTTAVGDPEPLEYYLPSTAEEAASSYLLVRVSGDPHAAIRRFEEAALSLDARLQPTVRAVADSRDLQMRNLSHILAVVAMLGAIALLLSAIGLAGLAAYTVAQQTREIGVRMALGARAGQLVRAILTPMAAPVAVGFLCGILGGTAVAAVLRSGAGGLAGLRLFDPLAYLAALAFFLTVVALAVFVPARRATRIDPSKALQHE